MSIGFPQKSANFGGEKSRRRNCIFMQYFRIIIQYYRAIFAVLQASILPVLTRF